MALSTLSSINAIAAHSVGLSVNGRIIPAACDLKLTGGDTFNYGKISSATLNEDTWSTLPQKTLPFAMTCSGPQTVALRTLDQRYGWAMTPPGKESGIWFGMGMDNANRHAGAYSVDITSLDSPDGQPTVITASSLEGPWVNASNFRSDGGLLAFTKDGGSLTPSPVSTITGAFRMHEAAIAPTKDLSFAAGILLDGRITVELLYF